MTAFFKAPIILTLLLPFFITSIQAQPVIDWQKCLGGTNFENGYTIKQTSDGGFIFIGETFSNDGDVIGNHGNPDIWVGKLNSSGSLEWQKCLGGTDSDGGTYIQQTLDGGFILVGYTLSNDGDVIGNHGIIDTWVVKLSSAGEIQWQKCLGGTDSENVYSIKQTTDGGFVVVGNTKSNDGDVSGNHGGYDVWVVKLSSSGDIQWQKCLGGTIDESGISIEQTNDGSIFVIGFTNSNDGEVSGNHGGGGDVWVVKLSPNGSILWQKCLGGTNDDSASSFQLTIDGGLIIAGSTNSTDGDVSGNHGGGDCWVVKLNVSGNVEWQKCLGGTRVDDASSIQQTIDGGFIIAGSTKSNDGDVSGNHGNGPPFAPTQDVWVVKLSSTGAIQWQKCLGGTGTEYGYFIQQTTDGGFVIAANASFENGDVSGVNGDYDIWVVKLTASTNKSSLQNTPKKILISPNPTSGLIFLKTDPALTGKTYHIYNALGELLLSGQISDAEMPLSTEGLPLGIYTILAGEHYVRLVKE